MKEKIIDFIKLTFSFLIFMYFSAFISFILKYFGFNVSNLSLLSKTLFNLGISMLMTIIMIMLYRRELINDFKEFKYNWKSKVLFALKLFGIFMLFKLLSSYVMTLFSTIFNIEQITSENQTTINDLLGRFPILMGMSAIIFAPFYEEVLFRLGFKKCIPNKKVFILVSGLLFGLIHIFPTDLHLGVALIQSIPYVSMGLCLAYFYSKYENIFYSILVHFYNNLLSVIIILFTFLINLF